MYTCKVKSAGGARVRYVKCAFGRVKFARLVLRIT